MNLHEQIMNLPCACGLSEMGTTHGEQLAYKRGHKDARHAAAELAGEHETELAALRKDDERRDTEAVLNLLIREKQKTEALQREVRYLRTYGNKDCTVMADAAMERHELES